MIFNCETRGNRRTKYIWNGETQILWKDIEQSEIKTFYFPLDNIYKKKILTSRLSNIITSIFKLKIEVIICRWMLLI